MPFRGCATLPGIGTGETRGAQLAKWKEFESLIAALQKQTAGDATVLHNQRVKGRSGRMRQIDILISQKVGLYPVFIAIECKRHRRPVGIDKEEAFVTKLRDVSASQGVMISNTGFDAGLSRCALKLLKA